MKKTKGLINLRALMFILCCLAFTFQSCNNSPKEKEQTVPGFDLTTAKAEIEEANKNFMSLVVAGDSIGIAEMYTADAKLMFAGRPAEVGRANIQTTFSRILSSGVTKVNLETKEVFGTEDLLAEEGEVTVYVKDMAVAVEKYIILWKKEDGKWKLFRDIANSNSPAK
jgi:ketosteroid isomerase-like protein